MVAQQKTKVGPAEKRKVVGSAKLQGITKPKRTTKLNKSEATTKPKKAVQEPKVVKYDQPPHSIKCLSGFVIGHVVLHRIPEKCINFTPTATHMYLDTLKYTKKHVLNVPYPEDAVVDPETTDATLENGVLKFKIPIITKTPHVVSTSDKKKVSKAKTPKDKGSSAVDTAQTKKTEQKKGNSPAKKSNVKQTKKKQQQEEEDLPDDLIEFDGDEKKKKRKKKADGEQAPKKKKFISESESLSLINDIAAAHEEYVDMQAAYAQKKKEAAQEKEKERRERKTKRQEAKERATALAKQDHDDREGAPIKRKRADDGKRVKFAIPGEKASDRIPKLRPKQK